MVFPPEERDEATAVHTPAHIGFPISGVTVPVPARPSGTPVGGSGDSVLFEESGGVTTSAPQSSEAGDGGDPTVPPPGGGVSTEDEQSIEGHAYLPRQGNGRSALYNAKVVDGCRA